MINFDDFFKELCDNHVWFLPASQHHKPETFQKVANAVYMQYVAKETFPPIQEARRHVYNKLVLVPGDKVKVDWTKIAKKELDQKEAEKEWQPVSWDKRAEYLEQVQAEINKIGDKRVRPLFNGEAEANGQCDPPKVKAKCVPSSPVEVVINHINKLTEARTKYFLERNPNATEKEIETYLKNFPVI